MNNYGNRERTALVLCVLISFMSMLAFSSVSVAIDPPHTSDLNVTCANCHNPSITFTYATIDNTPWNEVCWSCHDFGASGSKLESDTHSAISTGDDTVQQHWGGTWTNECRACHDPHTNEQARSYQGLYPEGAWLYTGTIQSSTYNTITVSGSLWVDDEWVGKTLHPKAGGAFFYMIVDSTPNTLVVAGSMYPFIRMTGGTFAISYGKLIRKDFNTGRGIINSSGVVFDSSPFRTVKFLNSSGPSSWGPTGKDTETATDAICVVCHTQTRHMNVGVAKYGDGFDKYNTYSHYYSDNQTCWVTCHNNSVNGFGATCLDCHGYAPTTPASLIDEDALKGPTGRTSPGAHELHYDEKHYECTICHDGGSPLSNGEHGSDPPEFQIGFNVFGNKGGQYTAPVFPNSDYTLVSGNVETTVSTGISMTCSGVYCHSTVQADGGTGAPTYGTPVWDGSVVCGDCHKSDGVQGNASKMDTGGHAAHVDESGVNCSSCHDGNNHVDGNVDVTDVTYTLSYSSGGTPKNGYGSCAAPPGGCHIEIQWGNGACIDCHATAQSDRVAITPQFSANSHHVQGGTVKNEHCYQCHWEAKSEDGRIDPLYHGGSDDAPDRSVDLVIYKSDGTRPTSYNEGTTAVKFTANGTRTEFAKLNNHCLGCHSDGVKGVDVFNDGKSPDYYAWDSPKTSIDARYSQTGTQPWGKYSANAKDTQTKAYSAHGKAGNNQRGWNTSETWPNTSGAGQVLCFDCHNAHGSTVLGSTTSYANMNTPNGAILKDTMAYEGGYSMAYMPQAGGSIANKNAYNAGAGLCFDCHLTAAAGARPWGYNGTFGATQSIMGYLDTPRFGPKDTYATGPGQRFGYKSRPPHQGGHFGASSGLANAASYQIGGLCTPCHDPHGISDSLGTNKQYALPLLKGTWITSPYKEDRPPASNTAGTVRTDQGKEGVGYHRTPDVTQSDTQFAGLCLKCHPKNRLTDGSANGTWKSIDRIHESVNGWGSTMHNYSCSKCHAPHSSRLPRLMVTNCMDKRHKGRMAYNASPALSGSGSGDGDGCNPGSLFCSSYWSSDPDESGFGSGKGNFPGVYQWGYGTSVGTTPITACHVGGGKNSSWDDQSWNTRTQWTPPIVEAPTAKFINSTAATLGATIVSDGSATITNHGTVWGTSTNPTGNALPIGGRVIGEFSHERTGWSVAAGTKIYYRGYAWSSYGRGYSPTGSFYTEPSTPASGVSFVSVTTTSMRVNWNRGNGNGVIVLMKKGSPVSSPPADGTYTGYTANPAFGSGTQIGSGNYVIYKGTGTYRIVTGLTPGTTYYVAVYEYSGTEDTSGGGVYQGTNYISSPATGYQNTVNSRPILGSSTATGIIATTANLGATIIANGGVPITEYGTVWGTATDPTGNADPISGSTIGAFTQDRTGLPISSKIYYRGYATNSIGTGYSTSGSFHTEPSTQASGVNIDPVASTSMTVNWTRGNGTGVIVLMRQSFAVTFNPADGTYTGYVANAQFGSGTQVSSGTYVVYKGDGTNATVFGLVSNMTYYVAVYEYSGTEDTSGGGLYQGTNYKSSPATGYGTTIVPSGTSHSYTFIYNGSVQYHTVPSGATGLLFILKGAGGGGGRDDWTDGYNGQGGHLAATLQPTPGSDLALTIYIGGGGPEAPDTGYGASGGSGYHDGASGGDGDYEDQWCAAYGGAGGGGSSAVVSGSLLAEAAGGAGGTSGDMDCYSDSGGDGGAGGGSDYPSGTTGGSSGGLHGDNPTAGVNGQVIIKYYLP